MIEMSNQDRWGSSSSSAKRPATENGAKLALVPSSHQAKRRVPLSCLTNQANVATNSDRPLVNQNGLSGSPASSLKKGTTHVQDTNLIQNSYKDASLPSKDDQPSSLVSLLAPCSTGISPCISDGDSVSLDETMSTCDSCKSPDFEYIYNGGSSVVASLERKACHDLFISKQSDGATENVWKGDVLIQMQTDEGLVINVDGNHRDTQLCAEYACDIYNHLRIAEMKKRPAIDFIERVQKDITASMRALLIDWLVEVAEEYRLMPDTLYLTVNYIDRYLSGNVMNRQRLQLLGVACMLISAKYEEICAPQVEEFCYITDNTYFRDEVLEMESAVLKYLKFELTVPTVKCFLRRFILATQGCTEVPLHLEFLANYIAELSLLEYDLLGYSSSLIAASAVFLAKFISLPTERPWNTTLRHYTQYRPSELHHCVKVLQSLFCNSHNSNLPALREKYSQQKYKSVSLKFCPQTIPSEFFEDLNC